MCQTLLNTENPDLKIQSRPLQSSQPGAADSKHLVTEHSMHGGWAAWGGRASKSPSESQGQVRLSQETREPGIKGEVGGNCKSLQGHN